MRWPIGPRSHAAAGRSARAGAGAAKAGDKQPRGPRLCAGRGRRRPVLESRHQPRNPARPRQSSYRSPSIADVGRPDPRRPPRDQARRSVELDGGGRHRRLQRRLAPDLGMVECRPGAPCRLSQWRLFLRRDPARTRRRRNIPTGPSCRCRGEWECRTDCGASRACFPACAARALRAGPGTGGRSPAQGHGPAFQDRAGLSEAVRPAGQPDPARPAARGGLGCARPGRGSAQGDAFPCATPNAGRSPGPTPISPFRRRPTTSPARWVSGSTASRPRASTR
jgi:hypothetical protein